MNERQSAEYAYGENDKELKDILTLTPEERLGLVEENVGWLKMIVGQILAGI